MAGIIVRESGSDAEDVPTVVDRVAFVNTIVEAVVPAVLIVGNDAERLQSKVTE